MKFLKTWWQDTIYQLFKAAWDSELSDSTLRSKLYAALNAHNLPTTLLRTDVPLKDAIEYAKLLADSQKEDKGRVAVIDANYLQILLSVTSSVSLYHPLTTQVDYDEYAVVDYLKLAPLNSLTSVTSASLYQPWLFLTLGDFTVRVILFDALCDENGSCCRIYPHITYQGYFKLTAP